MHVQYAPSAGSHFFKVGSGRYDFWRVSVDAVKAHPLGGLGQDNFADYYITRRRTGEEPRWTHSLEFRLLAHTGIVGFVLFTVFLVAALIAAAKAVRRRRSPLLAVAAAGGLIPLIPWLVHGSVDWFWEVPALSGPAFAFLGMAAGLSRQRDEAAAAATTASDAAEPSPAAASRAPSPSRPAGRALTPSRPASRAPPPSRRPDAEPSPDAEPAGEPVAAARSSRRTPAGVRIGLTLVGVAALLAATAVLAFPYLSVRYTSIATHVRNRNPAAALSDLSKAADLNPLSPDPTRLAGIIALAGGRPQLAEQRFADTISREPGGWLAWLGRGLAASALGDNVAARQYLRVAASINKQQPVITDALARVNTDRPMTPAEAFRSLSAQT